MKSYNWLRWVGVLPGAIAAYFVIYALMKMLGYSSLYSGFGSDLDDYSWFTKVTIPAFASAIATYIFIKVGTYIAPKHKFTTAIILAACMVILLLFELSLQITFRFRWRILIEEFAGFVGLACAFFEKDKGIYIIYKQELQNSIRDKSNAEQGRLTPNQIAAFRKIYNAPDMPENIIMFKIQAVKQYKASLEDDRED